MLSSLKLLTLIKLLSRLKSLLMLPCCRCELYESHSITLIKLELMLNDLSWPKLAICLS